MRAAALAILVCLLTTLSFSQTCGNPGQDGPVTGNGVLNTYYPPSGAGTVSAGSTSIALGAATGANTQIQAGDMVLIIQMQDATIRTNNNSSYGANDGTGSGYLSGTAGQYEFNIANNAVPLSGGTLQLVAPLVNAYVSAAASGSQGQRTFQVIRVPQYSSVTLGSVTATPWNGATGGVVAIDVAGNLTLGGGTIDVSGQGFRGGGGVNLSGGSGSNSDYRGLSTQGDGGSKGEGLAGTPRYTYNPATGTVTDNTTEGYPNGSFDRGAPGNAGGGANDGNPSANDQNSGGGGGGNGGAGGRGGNSWSTNLTVGGIGGAAFVSSTSRLVMGGGGGAGTTNNSTGYRSSGGAGGGIVIVRAGTISGTGTINANGAAGQTPDNDGGGGGGAGGSVVVSVKSGTFAGLTINARGGAGGNNWVTQGGGDSCTTFPDTACNAHGPGGGGGGGVVYQSGGATVNVTGGAHGYSTTAQFQFGSANGNPGVSAAAGAFTGAASGAQCVPVLTVTKITTTPSVAQGAAATYKITVKNATGVAAAKQVSISDTLPQPVTNGFTYSSTVTVALSGGATRSPTTDPAAGATVPTWSLFTIPANGQVDITFTVAVASSVPAATYQNPATATYLDPGRTVANGTTSASYDPASSTNEDVRVLAATQISGFVYADTNHDGSLDPGETWSSGVTVYVNLLQSGAVVQSVQVPAGTGAYTFNSIAAGSYSVIVTNSATATAAAAPAGWIPTSPNNLTLTMSVGSTSWVNQNFGLFQGSRVSGKVFQDSGTGGGTANDGRWNGGEKGIAGVSVTASNGSGTTYDTATTDGLGAYQLWIPSSATSVTITETTPTGWVSTGADVGTTGGTYTRSGDKITFTASSGSQYAGVNFGDVPPNAFNADHAENGLPGSSIFYAHSFVAASGGQVSFSTSAMASPSSAGFSQVLYRDTNCNGTLDAGEPQITAAITVNEGDTVCLIVKEMITVNAPLDATDSITVTAQFQYTNANPSLQAIYTRSDVTTVGRSTTASLHLLKAANKLTARSGDTITYTITYTNVSAGAVSSIVVNDSTPSYTTFVSAACGPLPSGITACNVSAQPSVGSTGAVRWTLAGSLNPSASGQVTFSVKVQ